MWEIRKHRRLSIQLMLLAAALIGSGCDQVQRQRARRQAAASSGVETPRPQAEDVDTGEPADSGYDFTLWNGHVEGMTLNIDYKSTGNTFGSGYRLVVMTGDGPIEADLMGGGGSTRGRLRVRLMHGAYVTPGSTAYIETRSFGVRAGSGKKASNTITVGGDGGRRRGRVAGGPRGSRSSQEGTRESPPPSRGPTLGLGSQIDRAWRVFVKEFEKEKVAAIHFRNSKDLDVAETVSARAESLTDEHDGLQFKIVSDRDNVVLLLAPVDEAREIAEQLDVGKARLVDSTLNLVEVTVRKGLFEKNDVGIARDDSHPRYFELNYDLMTGDGSGFDFNSGDRRKEKKAATKRLAAADPQACQDGELRRQIANAFRELVKSEDALREVDKLDALEGFVNWSGDDAAETLISLLKGDFFSPFHRHKMQIVEMLGDLGDERAMDPLLDMLRASDGFRTGLDDDELRTVVNALANLGPACEEEVIELVSHNNPRICLASIAILEQVGSAESLSILRQALKSRNRDVRGAAKRAIGEINERRGVE